MELPHDDALRWIVTKYGAIASAYGEVIGEPDLLQPTGKHFPDAFTPDGESVGRLLARMIGYSPVDEETAVNLRFLEQEEKAGGGGCSSGACGTGGAKGGAVREPVVETSDGYFVDVAVADVGNATLLTTSLARSVGGLVLLEGGEDVQAAGEQLGALSELAAIATGFGVLLLEGSYVYGKSCGGVRVHQATSLSLTETAVALALFARVHSTKIGTVRANLGTTQREAFDHALEWVDSNEAIVDMLRDHEHGAEQLAGGFFTVEPVRSVLGRLFGKKKETFTIETMPQTERTPRTPEQQKKLDETRALVEEVLREG